MSTGRSRPNDTYISADALPEGEDAIVEIFGRTTSSVVLPRSNSWTPKTPVIEPLYADQLLDPVYQHGGLIYQVTPCSQAVAWAVK